MVTMIAGLRAERLPDRVWGQPALSLNNNYSILAEDVQTAVDQNGTFEIGPYNFSRADIEQMRAMLEGPAE